MSQNRGPKKRATQADVAVLAGVSQTAVSYVINGNDVAISEPTRLRIRDAMDKLNYVPNRSARSLRTSKSYTIATVIPDISNPFYPAFQRGIQDVTRQHDYDLVLYNTDEMESEEQHYLRSLETRQVDGAILALFHHDHTALHSLSDNGVALVSLVTGPEDVGNFPLDSIYIDNVATAREAVNHLVSKGHSQIGMLAGSPHSPAGQYRIEGYKLALNTHDLPMDENWIREGAFTQQGGYGTMKDLLAVLPRPSAVFAANDLMAIGAMSAIREAGLSIPDDIAIVGVDNIPAAAQISPSLTTITKFTQQLGRRAAEMLFERLNGTVTGAGRSVEMPFELIVRESA